MNFLVSANQVIVQHFKPLLLEHGEATCVAAFAGLLRQTAAAGTGLAVIDSATPDFDGDAGLRRLKRASPALKVLLVGGELPPQQELAVLAAGAMGCCDNNLSQEQVRRILRVIEQGGVWISNAALPHLLQRLRVRAETVAAVPDPVPAPEPAKIVLNGLTLREREIAQMVASGESNKLIARQLNITERTVKSHLTTIFQKLHMHDRLQLALLVNRAGQ